MKEYLHQNGREPISRPLTFSARLYFMPNNTSLTEQELIEIGVAGYLQELRLLIHSLNSDFTANLLPLFRDYENFLRCDLRRYFPAGMLQELAGQGNTLSTFGLPDNGRRLFDCANLAAACEIFNGWTIDGGAVNSNNSAQFLADNMRLSGKDSQQLGRVMGVRLNRGDAVRTAQIIKLFGLLPVNSERYDQLALGASMARRDREGFHRIPGIGPERPNGNFSGTSRLNFAVMTCEPKSLIMIDNDNNLAKDYARINREENSKIRALNLDLYDGLDRLAATIEESDCARRNLVTMYRLEPRALPDIPLFIDKLIRVIDNAAFFMATIGAGNSPAEFAARTAALDEITEQLRTRGFRPWRIIMHGQGNQPNGQTIPDFGTSEFSSFEILFCDLGNDAQPQRIQQKIFSVEEKPVPDLNPELWNSFLPSNRMAMANGIISFLERQGILEGESVEVLNLGSGAGVTSSCLIQAYPAFSITDIDQVPYKRGLMHTRYLQADVASLPFQDQSYGALFSSFAFSYLGNSKEVMKEWLRVLVPGGNAYFVFHAPHSNYLTTARQMLSENIAKDFLKLLQGFPGKGFTGMYDWFCQQNVAWKMTFNREREFLSYAHEIQVCKHLVEEVANLMFSSEEEIKEFFTELDSMDISIHILDKNFNVQQSESATTASFLAWFVVLRKPV